MTSSITQWLVGCVITSVTFGGYYVTIIAHGPIKPAGQVLCRFRSSSLIGFAPTDLKEKWPECVDADRNCGNLVSCIDATVCEVSDSDRGLIISLSTGKTLFFARNADVGEVGELEVYSLAPDMTEMLEALSAL